MVDAREAQEHVARLRDGGMPYARIAGLAGLSKDGLRKIYLGRRTRIQLDTHRRIMAVELSGHCDDADPAQLIPSFGAARRVQALCAMGFTRSYLAEFMGVTVHVLAKLAYSDICTDGRGQLVQARTAQVIEDAFETLQMTPVDSPILQSRIAKKCRTQALKRGWAPALYWDESGLDVPHATPDSPEAIEILQPTLTVACKDGWRKVGGGYDPRFEVSRDGYVRTLPYETQYRTSTGKITTRKVPGKVLSIVRTSGRPVVLLGTGGDTKNEVKLDRLVAGVFHGYPYESNDRAEASRWRVRHRDDDIWNCHADNLEWVPAAGYHEDQSAYEANLAAWEAAKQEPASDWSRRLFGEVA
ncbi:hypothetical protein FHT44_004956 [Mycolicibacterium sp. BK634]|uniref:hypothetical protein n=1 Tax=Mycolicibacterium sp. BK634 TaxID=2587099 RepID=UPI00161C71B8|nr:hypothetical protein [Mycolicibacterium sp. BK634]MBB3752444.1 hypothetical protein [Mycolicibacterium sp. BK634]